jgi:hypothetical protein
MRVGSKKIYHLEAWVVKVMSLYKVSFLSGTRHSGNEILMRFFSILCCKSTCRPLNKSLSIETLVHLSHHSTFAGKVILIARWRHTWDDCNLLGGLPLPL